MQHGFAKLSKGPDTFAAILRALAVPAVSRGVRTPILVADATANSRWISSASPSLTSTLHWFETEVQKSPLRHRFRTNEVRLLTSPAACRKLLDTAPIPADRRAHRVHCMIPKALLAKK
jgi:hypothetical protein